MFEDTISLDGAQKACSFPTDTAFMISISLGIYVRKKLTVPFSKYLKLTFYSHFVQTTQGNSRPLTYGGKILPFSLISTKYKM